VIYVHADAETRKPVPVPDFLRAAIACFGALRLRPERQFPAAVLGLIALEGLAPRAIAPAGETGYITCPHACGA
jgi:hypothetical protein